MDLWLKGATLLIALLVFSWVLSVDFSPLLAVNMPGRKWPSASLLLVKNQANRLEGVVRDLALGARASGKEGSFVTFCVDLGSRDESPAILERLCRDYPFLHVADGFSAAGDAMSWALNAGSFESLYVLNLCGSMGEEERVAG